MAKTNALQARNITLTFEGRTILEDFSLNIDHGDKVLLTGPSGCGKSTILKCFLGLATPAAGSILINGQILNHTSVWNLRKQIAYVAQEPDLGPGSARQILERPFQYRANAHLAQNIEQIPQLFELFKLPTALLTKNTSTISGGEKQRIALIAAIILDRPIFLLDEPTSALDSPTKKAILDYLRSRKDLTALFVAHDTAVTAFADDTINIQPTPPRGHK